MCIRDRFQSRQRPDTERSLRGPLGVTDHRYFDAVLVLLYVENCREKGLVTENVAN